MQDYNVLAPGPVNLHPEVQRILALPMIHHRTPEFDAILKRSLKGLKSIFQTTGDCFILSSTGSGGMECLIVNTLNAGDEVLAIDSGKFGERWADMAQVFGGKVHRLKVPWGEAVRVEAVKEELDKNQNIKLVLCQACETSTAVKHPIQEIGALVKARPQTLFLVDAITALGAFPLPMDEWSLDGIVGGSQKAFMLPTGLSFVSFSEKAWKVIEKNQTPRFYFDIRKEKAANQKGETYFSSSVTLIRALDFVLGHLQTRGLQTLFSELEKRADFTRKFGSELGLCPYPLSPSPSLTALAVPAGVDSQELRLRLEKDHHITVMGGQDQLKGKIIRIGHMGEITGSQMITLFEKLLLTLRSMKAPVPNIDDKDFRQRMEKFWNA